MRDGDCIDMSYKQFEQFRQEQDGWLRSLDFLLQENVHMKNRLAEIIKDDEYSKLLEKAEYFQAIFLNKDAVIALLRRDISSQSKKYDLNEGKSINVDEVADNQRKLRNDIAKMEKEFSSIKFDFNNFLSEVL